MTTPQYGQISKFGQLATLAGLFFGGIIIGLALSLGIIAMLYGRDMARDVISITNTAAPGFLNAFRIFLGLGNTLCIFMAPALVFGYYVTAEPDVYLKTRNYTPVQLYGVVILFIAAFLPVMDITSYWNQQLHLPGMPGLERWIRQTEKQAGDTMNMVLNMHNAADLLISLFLVAVLPALSEEFFFRGCMQTIFHRWTRNTHAAVWITAIIFSFIHFEFLGFVPRVLLGAGLGYLCAWSGSIWPSVLAHFLNNAFAVVATYLFQHQAIHADPSAPMFTQAWLYLPCLLFSVIILFLYHKYTLKWQLIDGKELD